LDFNIYTTYNSADVSGLRLTLASGAGHDGVVIPRICPMSLHL